MRTQNNTFTTDFTFSPPHINWKGMVITMELNALWATMHGISIYGELLNTPTLSRASELLDSLATGRGEDALSAYTQVFRLLRQEGFVSLGDWLWDTLRYTDSPYGALAARGLHDAALEEIARFEVQTLIQLAGVDCAVFLQELASLLPQEYGPVVAHLPRWQPSVPFSFDTLNAFYREHGCGLFAQYRAFLWDRGELIPVEDPDCPQPEELLGYELQRDQVLANTQAMLDGNRVNNVLLFGDGGTGKSATVKSMLYRPGFHDLRLIEVQKDGLAEMPRLIRSLAGRRQKFILFIDDLAFDQDDRTYSILKTILEGGLERRPANVAIYATSNRRHLVRQSFSDRAGDEVDAFETIAEKTALAERFGLRIPYLTMSKADYLALVDHLAARAGVATASDLLHAQAMTWEIRHAGRTPRTAQQFIASLSAQ